MTRIVKDNKSYKILAGFSTPELIAQGLFPDRRIINKFGRNVDVDGPEDIWNGGAIYTGQPITGVAETVIVTSSAGVTDAGLTCELFGLDSNYDEITEVVTLNGTGEGVTTQTFWRCPRIKVNVPATGQNANVGALTAAMTTTSAVVFAVMPAGFGQTQIAAYTIPNGYTGYVNMFGGSLLDAQVNRGVLGLRVRENVDGVAQAGRIFRTLGIEAGTPVDKQIYGGAPFPEHTDMVMTILSVSSTNADVTAYFDVTIIKNDT